jgi:inosine/xanthosine triphosphatase
MVRVCMGGTFDVLHRGHRALLDAAFAAGDAGVVIGLTTDAFANAHRERRVNHYEEREAGLRAYLEKMDYAGRAEVRPIETSFGFALEPVFDAIAVTPETAGMGERINAERAKLGIAPLRVVVAPYVLADDGRPIKATRVVAGELDVEGRLLRALRVAVGSDNPVKVEAVRRVFERVYGRAADVRGFAVPSGVPEQPFRDDTWTGARTRAEGALAAWPDADFGVGVEAGLLLGPDPVRFFDVQACVVVDAGGRVTYGQGPGFAYPEAVEHELREGRTVGEVLSRMAGVDDIGRKMGAVGWLTRGLVDRAALTEPAVLMALLPRMRPDAYGL